MDLILLTILALFIAFKLRSVLGKRMGSDLPPPLIDKIQQRWNKQHQPRETFSRPVVIDQAPELPNEEGDIKSGLLAIAKADPSFARGKFLQGAKIAFEMIIDAISKNNRKVLAKLLSPELKEQYFAELDRQEKENRREEVTLVSVKADKITEARLEGGKARITVQIESEQILLVKNAEGALLEGNPSDIEHLTDLWTFARDVNSQDPNWKLVSVASS